jgi:catechol 2,3-dioxygenase-like lactoylglutathione lyase family enzyme
MTAVAHLGLTVPDLERAVAWYRDVLGFDPLGEPVEVRAHEGHAGAVAADVFGPRLGAFRQAHLASANGAALELFEFVDPPTAPPARTFEYWKTGLFHFCVVARDIERAAERIGATGGRRLTRAWEIFPGEPYRTCYCEDPFGTPIELYSHGHERTYANRGTGG